MKLTRVETHSLHQGIAYANKCPSNPDCVFAPPQHERRDES